MDGVDCSLGSLRRGPGSCFPMGDSENMGQHSEVLRTTDNVVLTPKSGLVLGDIAFQGLFFHLPEIGKTRSPLGSLHPQVRQRWASFGGQHVLKQRWEAGSVLP